MNRFTLICTIFLALLLIFVVPRTVEKYNLHKSDNFVVVTIKKLPDCFSGNTKHRYRNKFIHINYKGSTHILRTKCKYVSGLLEGQQLEMLHKQGTEIFVFKEENVTFELISVILLSLAAVVCLVKSLKPTTPKSKERTTTSCCESRASAKL
jgi:hypothetical protein